MGRIARHLLVAGLAITSFAAFAPSAGAACVDENLPYSAANAERVKDAVACLVNVERTARGLSALRTNSLLDAAALIHSIDMATKNYFSHTSPAGLSPGDRLDAAGYDWRTYGENIAAGNTTARATMTQWITSDGHCRSILNPSFNELGVGVASGSGRYGTYWTQEFGSRTSGGGGSSNAAAGCPFRGLMASGTAVGSDDETRCNPESARLRITSLKRSRGKLRVAGRLSGVECCPAVKSQVKRGKRTKSTTRKLCAGSFVLRLSAPGSSSRAQVTLQIDGAKSARRSIRL